MPSPPNTPLDLTNCQRKNSEPTNETLPKTPVPNRRASSDSETTPKSEKIGPKISKKCFSPAKKRSQKLGIFKMIEIDVITLSSDDDETHNEKLNTLPQAPVKIKEEAPEELEEEKTTTEANPEYEDATMELLRNVKIE